MKISEGGKYDNLENYKFPVPIRYDSRSEFALCSLFEKYIPDWKAKMGETFQIQVGGGRTVDFLIYGTLLEYHPIMINREMKSSYANQIFRRLFADADRWHRAQLIEMLTEELGAQYACRRAAIISTGCHEGKLLVVCQSPEEIYKEIIQRHGRNLPKLKEFKNEFYSYVNKAEG